MIKPIKPVTMKAPLSAAELNKLIDGMNRMSPALMTIPPPDVRIVCGFCGAPTEKCTCINRARLMTKPLTIGERVLKWLKWNVLLTILAILVMLIFMIGQASAYEPTPSVSKGFVKNLTKTSPVGLAGWNETGKATEVSLDIAQRNQSAISSVAPKTQRICYCIKDCWVRWCENNATGEMAMFNGKGYKMFDLFWMKTQANGNEAQRANIKPWITWINEAKE